MIKRYDSYKDSGVEWIGEVPSHWDLIKTYLISENLDGKRIPLNSEERGDIQGVIPYWGSGGIVDYINKHIFDEELLLIGEDGSPFFDSYRDVSFYVNEKIWVNNHIHILRSKRDRVDTKFLVHSFNSVDYKEYITGSTRDKLTQTDLNRIVHPIPPLSEQQQIVSFLDTKTSLIDSLIEKTQRKIELLKEKRTSLINEVVTKGLNPNVEMKDSGVEWIGEIPSHWGKTKLKRYVSIFTGYSFKSDWFGEEGIPVIRISNIQDGFIDFTKSVYLTENYLTEYPDYVVQRDDTLICLTGSLTGKVGKFNHEVGLLNQRVGKIIVRGNKVLKGFIDKVFFFQKFQGLIKEMGEGISENFPNVSHLDVVELEIPLPPLSEQQQIVEYLDEQTQLIDNTISIEEKRIELLKEYRQSLISEVVTGKLNVTTDE